MEFVRKNYHPSSRMSVGASYLPPTPNSRTGRAPSVSRFTSVERETDSSIPPPYRSREPSVSRRVSRDYSSDRWSSTNSRPESDYKTSNKRRTDRWSTAINSPDLSYNFSSLPGRIALHENACFWCAMDEQACVGLMWSRRGRRDREHCIEILLYVLVPRRTWRSGKRTNTQWCSATREWTFENIAEKDFAQQYWRESWCMNKIKPSMSTSICLLLLVFPPLLLSLAIGCDLLQFFLLLLFIFCWLGIHALCSFYFVWICTFFLFLFFFSSSPICAHMQLLLFSLSPALVLLSNKALHT